jgi:hypothetical protein
MVFNDYRTWGMVAAALGGSPTWLAAYATAREIVLGKLREGSGTI